MVFLKDIGNATFLLSLIVFSMANDHTHADRHAATAQRTVIANTTNVEIDFLVASDFCTSGHPIANHVVVPAHRSRRVCVEN